jgi:mannose-6-phosphate isomerase class I
MAKYLDCEQPLSVQLHPGPEAIEALASLGRRPRGPRVRLADEHAKEENFFVLEPANSTSSSDQCHLLLGFEERELLPIMQELQDLTDLSRLLDNLQASVKRHADKVLKEMGITEPVGLQLPGLDAVTEALVYHLRREQNPRRLHQAVAAVGVIWMIWSLACVLPPSVGIPLFRDLNSPWLRHFRRVTLRRNQWVRVMPGMIHSWQGGGNIAIELSDRSDNTFRIVDYGREFRHATRRDMHYLEAMYAVTPDAVMDNAGALRCIHTMSQQDDCLQGQITARLIVGDGVRKWVPLLKSPERSFVMNPDGPVRLRAEGVHRRELTLSACRTALIAPDTHASVLIIRPNDRVLHIWPAQARR